MPERRRVAAFDPLGILAALHGHRVRFVVIGGFAAQLHGSPSLTADLDICPARDGPNLEALAAALRELDARLRGAPPGLRVPLDARALGAHELLTLGTRLGDLDVIARPAEGIDHEALAATAETYDLDGLRVAVAGLDDLIRMKRAAGRPKDRIELEVLGALRDELDRRSPAPSGRAPRARAGRPPPG